MQVKELVDIAEKFSPKYHYDTLGGYEFRDVMLLEKETGRELELTEDGMTNFLKYLTVPPKFYENLSPALRSETVKYLMNKWEDVPVLTSTYGNGFWNFYPDDTLVVPINRIAEIAQKIFNPDDLVHGLSWGEGFKFSVTTDEIQTEARVGDFTRGGIRFEARVGKTPYVSAYMERLVCANGMVAESEFDQVSLRGRTVDEIINEMEYIARATLEKNVPGYLNNWKTMTEIESKNPEQLIHRLVKEAKLPAKIESAAIDRAPALEANSYYDIVNLITALQHEEGINDNNHYGLQALGGNAVRDLGGHRCNSCQHALV